VALPVIAGGFVQAFVVLIDNVFLSTVSADAFNSAGYGGMFYVSLYMLGVGYANTAQVVIARRYGEKNYHRIGPTYMQALWFLLIFAGLLYLLLQFFGSVAMDSLLNDPGIREGTSSFLAYRSWGIFFAFINLSFVALYVGIARTSVLIVATAVTAVLNVILDYMLIFGNWGAPELGLEGAAIASSLSEAAACGIGIIYTLFFLDRKVFKLDKIHGIRKKLFSRIALLSIPLMIQSFMSLAAWAVFFVIVEKLGKGQATISNAVRNVYTVALIPLFGFSSTTRTYVSGLLAEKRVDEVGPLLGRVIIMSVGATLVLIHGCLFYPEAILGIWLSDSPELIAEGTPVTMLITGSLLLFSAVGVLFSVVSGSGDTPRALLIEVLSIMIYLTIAWYIAVYLKSSLMVVWSSEYIYFGLIGIFSLWYFKSGKWKTIRI